MSETHEDLGGGMDRETCHAWAHLFASDREALVAGMAARAAALGLEQDGDASTLIWRQNGQERCRWTFVADPSDIVRIRGIFNDDANVNSPACYVVVEQPDPSDRRGEVIFDIFRLNTTSYLWHFYRVSTPRK